MVHQRGEPGYRAHAGGIGHRLHALLSRIAREGLTPSKGRALPLIAIPVLGVGRGGNDVRQGDMIAELLGVTADVARRQDVDIAIVTPTASVFGALQAKRATPPEMTKEDAKHAARLGQLAADKRLSLFIGAGTSVPSGLPTWGELLERLAAGRDPSLVDHLKALKDSPLDQAELLANLRQGELGADVVQVIGSDARPSLAHALLAGLNATAALTTNYDDLYEEAVMATGRPRPVQLPAERKRDEEQWLLKMHGSRQDPGSIVLTRSDFVHFDARVKPAASVLQNAALTTHLMMVGASLKDENVIRLLLEVAKFRTEAGVSGPFATLLGVFTDPARAQLWEHKVDWLTMGSGQLPGSGRSLEIFLDEVARAACRDASWLLDERFKGLLMPGEEQSVAGGLRDLAARVQRLAAENPGASAWRELDHALRDFGVQDSL